MISTPATVDSEGKFWAVVGLTIIVLKIGTYFVVGLLVARQLIEPAIGVGLAIITAIVGRIGSGYCISNLEGRSAHNMKYNNGS